MAKINLDAKPAPPTVKEGAPPQSATPPISGVEMGLTIVKKDVQPKAAPPTIASNMGLKQVYDRLQKLVFAIDISGSMSDLIAGQFAVDMFIWSADTMQALRTQATECSQRIEKYTELNLAGLEGNSEAATAAASAALWISDATYTWAALSNVTDDAEFKLLFLQKNLIQHAYVPFKPEIHKTLKTKMQTVKDLAGKIIAERFQKHKGSDCGVLLFNEEAEYSRATTEAELLQFVANVQCHGGTDIMKAMKTVIAFVRSAPSQVGLNHIVLVTDAGDYSACEFPELIPQFKQYGIVVDFIYVGQPEKGRADEIADEIKKAVTATGGTYNKVTDMQSLQQIFIESANRLMLPPASA